jgi:MFS superfamily sulfate permease-like transporter
VTLLIVLVFFTAPLSMLPISALAAIIISACIGLFNFGYLKKLFYISKREFTLAVFTSLCVITIGVLPAVLIAVGIALLRLLIRSANPRASVLGKVDNIESYQDISEFHDAKTIPGLLIYRYEAPLLFYNADNMRSGIRSLVRDSEDSIRMVLIDTSTFLTTDVTGVETLEDLRQELSKQNITLAVARAKKEFYDVLDRAGIAVKIGKENFFNTIREGVDSYQKQLQTK